MVYVFCQLEMYPIQVRLFFLMVRININLLFNLLEGGFTLKNSDGFTLIEMMISLFVFSVAVIMIFPAIVAVQTERQAIRVERFVEEKINSYYEQVFLMEEEIYETF